MYFYPLFSGSSGNCCVVRDESATILVDAGLSGSTIIRALNACKINPDSISAIVVTHEHSDHIKGVGVLSRKYSIPVYANANTWEAMECTIGNVSERNIRVFDTGHDFFIGGINVRSFNIPHDCVEPVAYSFYSGKQKLSVATDIGHSTPTIESEIFGSNIALIESNHDVDMLKRGPYPASLKRRILGEYGHLSNESCAKLILKLHENGLRRVILGHLSHENNTESCAFSTVMEVLERNGVDPLSLNIDVAHRDRILGIFEV